MDQDERDERLNERRPGNEGVRIIGAEEAAAALEKGEAVARRGEDELRYGDKPPAPSGPRPTHRFPLPDSVDPSEVAPRMPPVAPTAATTPDTAPAPPPEAPAPAPTMPPMPAVQANPAPTVRINVDQPLVAQGGEDVEMPHWTEPATGEVPRVVLGEDPDSDELEAWSGLASRGPRWRGEEEAWDESEGFDDELYAPDSETRVGALDTSRTEHSDLFSFDDPATSSPQPPPIQPVQVSSSPTRTRIKSRHDPDDPADDPAAAYRAGSGGGGRDLGAAVGVGVGLILLAAVLAYIKPVTFALLAGAVVTFAAVEFFNVARRAGYKPATLLGLTATVSLMAAGYSKGERAIPLVLGMTIVFSLLWYLFGVEQGRPLINVAVTVMGVVWIGVLGSFATLILHAGNLKGDPKRGCVVLLSAILCTVAHDILGYAVGSAMGRTPLSAASPNKTREGLVGGMLGALVMGVIVGAVSGTWGIGHGFLLGLVVAVMAPLGDLAESMLKRDIGLKDMGSILPGHGGVLDRFDALLFVLPATYYLAVALKITGFS